MTSLAVVKAQTAQHRASLCHSNMVWPIMPHQDNIMLKVAWMDLGKTPACLQSINYQHGYTILDIQFTRVRNTTASEDRTIRLWNPQTGESLRLLFTRYDHAVCSISFSPDGLMLARAGQNKDIKIWEVTTGTELMTLLGKDQFDHNWSVCTAFSPDGIHLVSGSDIGKLKLYEVLPSGEEKIAHDGHWRNEADDEETENHVRRSARG